MKRTLTVLTLVAGLVLSTNPAAAKGRKKATPAAETESPKAAKPAAEEARAVDAGDATAPPAAEKGGAGDSTTEGGDEQAGKGTGAGSAGTPKGDRSAAEGREGEASEGGDESAAPSSKRRKKPVEVVEDDASGVNFGLTLGIGKPNPDFEQSVHVGLSLGGHVHKRVSIHGQADLSYLRFSENRWQADQVGGFFTLGVAPLFHLLPDGPAQEHADVMLGIPVGFFGLFTNEDGIDDPAYDTLVTASSQNYGLHFGPQLVAIYKVSPGFAAGLVFHYAWLKSFRYCSKYGEVSKCDSSPESDGQHFSTFGIGLWF